MFNDKFIYENGQLLNAKTKHVYHNKDRDGYIRVRINGIEYRAHRIIWEMHNGPIPVGMLIDHIDGNVSNNKIENLRLATRQQNNANRSKMLNSCKTGHNLPKGVVLTASGKFRARIGYKGETHSLGIYSTIEEAETAYNEAAEILNGQYIHSNPKP